MSWAYAYAFNRGADHDRCDDVAICEMLGDFVIAAVADGAGSAKRGREGACLTCETFLELAVGIYGGTIDPSCLITAVKSRIPEADHYDHSCTLVGAIAGPSGAMVLQIGDGAVVTAHSNGPFTTAIPPEKSEFLNQTYFVTSPDAEEHLHLRKIDAPVTELALFTDGLQHLVINLADDEPHQPFFQKVFSTLGEEAGLDKRTSWWLERTLASESVVKRTDDDTSIVVARRLPC